MKAYVVSSSPDEWWDAVNDVVVIAHSKEEAINIADSKFEQFQKPLKVKEFELDNPQIIFENFDLG